MVSELRTTGIPTLGEVPWGTHFCLFYETRDDLLDLLIPYFKAGLENREFCLCVASEPVIADDVERALRATVPDFESALGNGQIEIISHQRWYLADGHFDPVRVRQGWVEKLQEGLARGFAGMRFAANIFWLEKQDWETFADYEGMLDEVFGKLRILAVCAYSVARCSAADLLDVVRHHHFAAARRHGAWERLEGPELHQAHAEIQKLNADLERRVETRTAELAAANARLLEEVAERKRAEDEIRRSEVYARQVLDTIPQQIWSGPANGTLDYCNRQWRAYTGLSLEELQGDGWQRMLHPEDKGRVLTAWRESVATGAPYEQEERHLRVDGAYRWFLCRGVPLRDVEGRIERWYGANTDIEDRKRAERALREYADRLQYLSRRLLAVQEEERRHIARELHDEFGQLLAAASLHLQAARGATGDDARQHLDECLSVLRRAGGEVRTLALQLRPIMLETAGLDAALRWLVEQHERQTGMAVRVEGHVESVAGDLAIACFRVVQEALTNVVRHARARQVWIELSQSDNRLEVVVRDDGMGFDVQRDLGPAAARGSLGLLGMRERVELLGGSLTVESTPGRGTRIRATFPLHVPPSNDVLAGR